MDMILNPIATINLDDIVISHNQSFFKYCGPSFSQISKKPIDKVLPKLESDLFKRARAISLEKNLLVYFYKTPRLGDPTKFVDVCLLQIRDATESLTGFGLILRCAASEDFNQNFEDFSLTTREREVMQALITGVPQKKIARILGISPFTVNDHLKSAYIKMGVNSRAEAQFVAVTKMGMGIISK